MKATYGTDTVEPEAKQADKPKGKRSRAKEPVAV